MRGAWTPEATKDPKITHVEQNVQAADKVILHATEVLGTEQPLWLYLRLPILNFFSRIQNQLMEEQPVLQGKK